MEAQKCGNYLLRDRINIGGYAEVFLASSPEHPKVALRRLKPEYKFNLVKRREFIRGLEIQQQMIHPNIVQVYQLASLCALPYAVMEFIEGQNLRQTIAAGEKSLSHGQILAQMLDSLAYVHHRGYLHLDFKPENILLTPQQGLKLLDFDLAMKIRKTPKAQPAINGTPSYLAPEQIQRLPLDERADIYAFGITAFELCTGQKPFKAHERQEIFHEVCTSTTAFPKASNFNPSIPGALDQLISRCIEKNPDRRYPTAGLISMDLQKTGLLGQQMVG